MVKLNEQRTSGGGAINKLFAGATAVRHRAVTEKEPMKDRETIVRIIPEVSADGSILPMVLGGAGEDIDVSALKTEVLTSYAGMEDKYTGWGQCSDRPGQDTIEMPFPRTFIILQNRDKNNKLSDSMALRFARMRRRVEGKSEPLPRPEDVALVQCVVLKHDGRVLEKPAVRQVLVLSKMAKQALNKCLAAAHARGVDVFSPENGMCVHFSSTMMEDDGVTLRRIPHQLVSLGQPMPLRSEQCKQLWIPWETCLVRDTYDHQVRKLVAAFGQEVAREVLADDVERLFPSAQQQVVQPQQTYVPPPQQQPAHVQSQVPAAPQPIDLDLTNSVDLSGDDDDDAGPAAAPHSPTGGTGPSGASAVSAPDPQALQKQFEDLLGNDDDLFK